MEKIKFYGNKKREKGAITLFVLLACLFFVFILTGVYLSLLNRAQVQEQEVQQIRDNYAKDFDRIEEIYDNLAKTTIVILRQEPANGTWTKEVTLVGNAKVDEESTATIVGYIFNQESTESGSTSWSWKTVSGTNIKEIKEEEKVTNNGKYYFWVKDSEGEIHRSNEIEVKNIDKNNPTAGTLVAKEQNEDETESDYDLEKSPWTDKDVKIEKVDGTDGEGKTETVYTILKNGVEYEGSVTNPLKDPTTLTETGEYTVTVITKDEVGNTAQREYTIRIDKGVPILALKHNDVNGAEYEQGTWTKDNLYGEINLDTTNTGKEVEKYQYSENGVIWKDITGKITQSSIDYTTTFPMSGDKPDWITGPINNGTYYFETQADGTLKPTNGGNTGSTNSNTSSDSYFEIDLTNYPKATLDIILNTTISSESNWDYGYAEITESTSAIDFNKNNEYDIKVSGTTTTKDYTMTLRGGKRYYLHIGYYKDSSNSYNQDTFIINNMTLKMENLIETGNFSNYNKIGNKVTFIINKDVDKEIYVRAVYTDTTISKSGSETSIKIDKTGPVIESANPILISREDAKLEVNATDKGSGVRGYYISTGQTAPTENSSWVEKNLNEFTIEGLKANTTYYLWTIDKVGNISERKDVVIGTANYTVDDNISTETLEQAITAASDGSIIKLLGDYTDTSIATFDKSVTFNVQSYTLTRRATITINNEETVEITGTGKITSGTSTVRTITNNGTLTVSNSITIENSSTSPNYAPIYNNSSSAIININDSAQIIGYYRGIYNYYGTLNVNGGKIEATNQSSSAYGIYNYSSSSKTYITNGEIKGYYGIRNDNNSSIIEMTGGKVVGTGACGVYAYGTTNIYGGRIEGKTYGICSYSTNKVTIGREEDQLSITEPAIYGASYGIYMDAQTYSFNFYNGVIISNTKETNYRGEANLRRDHMTYTYFDEVEQKYCTILIPIVGNITMEATPTEYTNGDVTVTITYPNSNYTKQYSEDGIIWKDANDYIQEVIVTENKTIYARVINESEVITDENQIEITNIDKEKPTVTVTPNQTVYTVTETNGTVDLNITLTAQDTGVSGLDEMQYAWVREGEQVTSYTDFSNTVTINKSRLGIGQYHLYIKVTDRAGNEADLTHIRYTVRYEEPVCQIGNTKYLSIQDAIETCSKEDTSIEYKSLNYETTFPMSGDKPDFINGPINNGTYYFETQADRTLKPNNRQIDDSTANSYFEIDLSAYPDVELEITLNVTISSETNYDFGYATITTEQRAPDYNSSTGRFIYISGATKTANYMTTLTGGQKYYLHIGYYKDSSNSYNQDTFIINSMKIEGMIPEEVGATPTTIEMLKSTDEEFNTYEGQKIILDLKGYTVGSSSIETPLCTNNGTLQLVDTSTNKTGKLESLNGTTILNNGTFTLGDNSTEIEYEVPTIYGKQVGVENNNIFNFYDGKIQGITPIQGNTTDTPDQYGPVSTGYEDGITTIQLGIVTGYEARIDWVYYTTLKEAVEATKLYEGSYRDTVTIIKDIQLTNVLEISENKDFILDLNGYTLTVTEQDRVINNNGNLEITDSSVEQTGKITIESTTLKCYGIYNNSTGNMKLSKGTISVNSIQSYGLYNNNIGNIEILDATIESISIDSRTSYGIYNNGTGVITIEGGNIYSKCCRTSVGGNPYAYGIYNANNGTIEIKGANITSAATISTNGNRYCYGIYNTFGVIKITSGTTNITFEEGKSTLLSYGICNSNGLVEITGGTVSIISSSSDESYGIYNYGSGSIEVTDGMIINNNERESFGIYNLNSGTVIVKQGIVKSHSSGYAYGIYNNVGTIKILGGSISGTGYGSRNYGIYNEDKGIIIIGEDNTLINMNQPKIEGKYEGTDSSEIGIGLYNKIGNIEFYNGIIQGNISLNGNITKVKEGYQIEKSPKIEEMESIYLVEKINAEYIVQIEESKYNSLQAAINSIEENEDKIIKVIKDFELNEPIEFNKNVIIDLNSYTITNNYYSIQNTKNLKITDLNDKNGKIETNNEVVGILNLKNGKIEIIQGTISIVNSNSFGKTYGIYNIDGKIEITGGIINCTGTNDCISYGIYNSGSGIVKISAGSIRNDNINYYTSSYGILNCNEGIIEITGGTINNYSKGLNYGIYNLDSATVRMTGGTISCLGNVNCSYGIYNVGTGNVIMEKGTIYCKNNAIQSFTTYGIYNHSNGTVIMTGGEINNETSKDGYGIYNRVTGSIIIGTKGDGMVSQEEPYIKGVEYGIYNIDGEFYFYDGKLEGSTKAFYDILTEYEENTALNYQNGETILTLSTTLTPVAQIGTTKYNTLQEAINAVGSSKTTIQLLRNVAYTKNDNVITIPSNKNITLDLKGYKISSAIPEKVIENNGMLEITDTSTEQTGIIVTNEEQTIINASGGKLTISGGIIENRNNDAIYNEGSTEIKGGTIKGTLNSIYNSNGSLIVSGGMVTGNNISSSKGIYNIGTGNVKITGGEVFGAKYGIYNYNTGTIEVTGGLVRSNNSSVTNYGIYNNSTGTITIGIKNGTISNTTPEVTNNGFGGSAIYNPSGVISFYDGTIKGTTKAISGNISEVENLTELNISSETIDSKQYEVLTLQQKTTNVARVNGTEYDSIEKAIKSCGTTESTIEILRDSDPGATIIIETNQNITIDLKGYTINNYIELQNKGTLKIKDTSSAKSGKIVGLGGMAISNSGTMELQSGSVADSGYGIKNTGTLTVNGGTISNNTYGIYNDSNGLVNVNSGNITSNTYGIYNYSGTTNISGTAIAGNDYGLYNAGGNTTIKEGAEVQSDIGIYVAGGRVNIGETGTMNTSTPIITGENYGLSVAPTGIVYMYDGQIKGKTGATQGFITYTESGYAVANKVEGGYWIDYLALAGTISTVAEVNGVSYSNLQSAINSVVGTEPQTIKLTNGIISDITFTIAEGQNIILDMNEKTISSDLSVTINNAGNLTIIDSTSSGVGKISSTTGTAIANSGTLTLGKDDGTVSQELITIEGQTYGIETTGTLNFYDGTINGGSAVQGTITNRAPGYVIRITTVNGKERYYLSK